MATPILGLMNIQGTGDPIAAALAAYQGVGQARGQNLQNQKLQAEQPYWAKMAENEALMNEVKAKMYPEITMADIAYKKYMGESARANAADKGFRLENRLYGTPEDISQAMAEYNRRNPMVGGQGSRFAPSPAQFPNDMRMDAPEQMPMSLRDQMQPAPQGYDPKSDYSALPPLPVDKGRQGFTVQNETPSRAQQIDVNPEVLKFHEQRQNIGSYFGNAADYLPSWLHKSENQKERDRIEYMNSSPDQRDYKKAYKAEEGKLAASRFNEIHKDIESKQAAANESLKDLNMGLNHFDKLGFLEKGALLNKLPAFGGDAQIVDKATSALASDLAREKNTGHISNNYLKTMMNRVGSRALTRDAYQEIMNVIKMGSQREKEKSEFYSTARSYYPEITPEATGALWDKYNNERILVDDAGILRPENLGTWHQFLEPFNVGKMTIDPSYSPPLPVHAAAKQRPVIDVKSLTRDQVEQEKIRRAQLKSSEGR